MKEYVISEKESNQRIDKYIKKVLNEAPLSFIYRLFRVKDIKVNNKRVDISYIVKQGDQVKIFISDSQLEEFSKKKEFKPVKANIDIVYEDENILIVNKPRGILVHGDENEKRITLSNQVLNYLFSKNEYDPSDSQAFIPGPAHRLDRNTSGLVLFGKNLIALQELFELIKEKENISKHYYALVNGRINKDGIINKPLRKDEKRNIVVVDSIDRGAKEAISKYSVKENFPLYTLMDVELITGRTHQIRVHFSSIKHPLIGDSKYGDFSENKKFEKKYKFHDQFLHAYKIVFHNIEGKLAYLSNKTFIGEMPRIEKEILSRLKEGN